MTSTNSPWNEGKNKPFLLKPVGKSSLWGGNRLNDDFSKGIDMSPLAESWECSTHPDGLSTVISGEFAGQTLRQVLQDHPEFQGSRPNPNGELPILIKLIDAKESLSVQVHPDDDYANANENGQLGKTEMWYVLDAEKNSHLYFGLRHNVTLSELQRSIQKGELGKHLNKVSVKKNDVFYMPAGTVHALGAGVLVAEIQENSNLTYRIYDFDRVDKFGNKRELHIEKALQVAKRKASTEPAQPFRVLKYRQGCATELLCRCKHFEVHRMLVNTERCRQMVDFRADAASFRVLLCYEGCGCFYVEDQEPLRFFKGDCIFVPANSVTLKIHGTANFLDVRG